MLNQLGWWLIEQVTKPIDRYPHCVYCFGACSLPCSSLSLSLLMCVCVRRRALMWQTNPKITILTGSCAWSAGCTRVCECSADVISGNDKGWGGQLSWAPGNKAAPKSTGQRHASHQIWCHSLKCILFLAFSISHTCNNTYVHQDDAWPRPGAANWAPKGTFV